MAKFSFVVYMICTWNNGATSSYTNKEEDSKSPRKDTICLDKLIEKRRHIHLWTQVRQNIFLVIFYASCMSTQDNFSFQRMLNKKKHRQRLAKKSIKYLLVIGEKFNNLCFCQNVQVLRDDFFYRSSELESECIGIKLLRLPIHVLHLLVKFSNFEGNRLSVFHNYKSPFKLYRKLKRWPPPRWWSCPHRCKTCSWKKLYYHTLTSMTFMKKVR